MTLIRGGRFLIKYIEQYYATCRNHNPNVKFLSVALSMIHVILELPNIQCKIIKTIELVRSYNGQLINSSNPGLGIDDASPMWLWRSEDGFNRRKYLPAHLTVQSSESSCVMSSRVSLPVFEQKKSFWPVCFYYFQLPIMSLTFTQYNCLIISFVASLWSNIVFLHYLRKQSLVLRSHGCLYSCGNSAWWIEYKFLLLSYRPHFFSW